MEMRLKTVFEHFVSPKWINSYESEKIKSMCSCVLLYPFSLESASYYLFINIFIVRIWPLLWYRLSSHKRIQLFSPTIVYYSSSYNS